MVKRLFWVLFLMTIILSLAIVYVQTQPKLNKPFALPESALKEHWTVQTGLKIATLNQNIPTINKVVLVPDEPTFLAAIKQWSLKGRWPILIEDQEYTPLFLNKFKPAEVIKMPKTEWPVNQPLKDSILQAIAPAWEAKNYNALRQKWDNLGWQPPGVVITSEYDSALPAAVALAADRGQPLVFLENDFGKPNDTLSLKDWRNLKNNIEEAVKNTGYPYKKQADVIDTITLVKEIAVKYQSPNKPNEFLSITDGLARDENNDRWALVGWIFGSPTRSLYQAMSAIFLDPKTAFLYDGYVKEGNWKKYEMTEAAKILKTMNIDVTLVEKPASSLETWQSLAAKKWEYDLIFVNSSGGAESFNVGSDTPAKVKDIPQFISPPAIHFIHSWSATTPANSETVAGRWLKNGAYMYVGSVHEPYLAAFLPPQTIALRLQQSAPFLASIRQLQLKPWKITMIGDPLKIFTHPRNKINPAKLTN